MNEINKKSRREFFKAVSLVAGMSLLPSLGISKMSNYTERVSNSEKRIGIIGLDTSHSEVFTRLINEGTSKHNFKVVAAYPHGSADIQSALKMKPRITKAVEEMGVEIVNSIASLLKKVDYILLETNDGRPHYEQALPVLKAGKLMFIDKPISHSLSDTKRIFEAAKQYNSPIFSSSALRYEKNTVDVLSGSYGAVIGADVYSPAAMEKDHLDFSWYGIHGVEMLYTLMGTGCEKVMRTYTEETDVLIGVWKDGRIGTIRGIRKGAADIAGIAFCEKEIKNVGPFTTYQPLVDEILGFFDTGIVPVGAEETIEMFKFMHAADRSKRLGKFVKL